MKGLKKILATVATLMMFVLVLSACSTEETSTTSSNESTATASETEEAAEVVEASELRVALLIPGNLGDKSYFDGSKAAIDEIEAVYGAEIAVVEMGTDTTGYLATYQDYSEAGYDLILTISTAGDDVLKEVALEYPDQLFINLDTDSVGFSDNVLAVVTKTNEMSALAGVVAAIKAEELGSDVIGFIGGMDIPGINYFLVGYVEGAQMINPDIKVNASYVGSFTDSATAKELANIMYDSGVEIIYQAAGGSGLGVFESALEKNKLAIGVDSDQAISIEESKPEEAEHIITSAVKKVNLYAVDLVGQYSEGTLEFGQTMSLGLVENSVGIAENKYYEALMSQEQIAQVEAIKASIMAGEITLTDTYAMTTEEIDAIRSSVAPN